MFRFVLTGLAALAAPMFLTAALGLGTMTFAVSPAAAQHKMDEDDMELPTGDANVVELGKEKYAQRCSFCHGGAGKGGKGPCLSCGKFTYSGNRNTNIYATIAGGINNRSLGGTMGAFGTTMSMEEITAVLTYLRVEEARRLAAGEIQPPER
jgi:mono/diheme cytochrome c family protein